MPEKSKKGGGLESSPVYKKQGYGEGVSPFTMRSGNTTPFKQMGSSPLKQDYHEAIEHHKKYVESKKPSKKFNWKGGKSTTPGFKDTKIGKALSLTKKGNLLALMLGATKTTTADQPVKETKKMSEEEMKSVQTDISKQMNPLKKKKLTKKEIIALANKQKEDAIQRNIKKGGTRKQAVKQYKRNIKK